MLSLLMLILEVLSLSVQYLIQYKCLDHMLVKLENHMVQSIVQSIGPKIEFFGKKKKLVYHF